MTFLSSTHSKNAFVIHHIHLKIPGLFSFKGLFKGAYFRGDGGVIGGSFRVSKSVGFYSKIV